MLKRRAFTLIELLTVIAISGVLMTIIVVPVFQSFNFTRSAQAFADAQSKARVLTDRISREIGNSVGVRSTSLQVQTTLNGVATNLPQHSLVIQVPKKGFTTDSTVGTVEVVLPYTKLDLLKPAEGDASNPNINPVNGFTDPTIRSPKGQVVLPVGIGATIIRYFIGLRDPLKPYNNPYDGILMAVSGNKENLFSLYRAEVQPYVFRNQFLSGVEVPNTGKFRPNLAYFQSDSNATDTQIIDYDDPRFFLNDGADANKITRIQAWQKAAVLQSELNRYDMIQPIYSKVTHIAQFDGNAPRIVPLIQFRPSHVGNDPAQGQVAVRQGEETNNAAAIGPDVFKTQFGLWSNQIVRVWPQTWGLGAPNTVNQYFVGRNDPSNGNAGAPPGFSVYYFDPAVSFTDVATGVEVFDVSTYEAVATGGGRYPFSQGVSAANFRSNWLSNNSIRNLFVPFDVNTSRGRVLTSFAISEVGNPNVAPSLSNPQNLPTTLTSPAAYGPYMPNNDPDLTGNFYDAKFSTINELFNKVWNDADNLRPQIERFMDLRLVTAPDGSVSPLHPTLGFPKSRIVPGSEVVYGPDQLAGPNFGATIRYIRTTHTPGPNQYRINYVDQPEPLNSTGQIDYTLLGLNLGQIGSFNPNVYDAQNFCSAVIQPRFKKGYIQFNSSPSDPLPIGPVQVSYRFQFNGSQTGTAVVGSKSDVFAVDYDTRQLMSVLLTIRNYPQTTNIPNPQTVTLKATAAIRNYLR